MDLADLILIYKAKRRALYVCREEVRISACWSFCLWQAVRVAYGYALIEAEMAKRDIELSLIQSMRASRVPWVLQRMSPALKQSPLHRTIEHRRITMRPVYVRAPNGNWHIIQHQTWSISDTMTRQPGT